MEVKRRQSSWSDDALVVIARAGRDLVLRCSLACLCWSAGAQPVASSRLQSYIPPDAARSVDIDPALGLQTVLLWPGGAPGAHGTSEADSPTLTVFAPRQGSANGTGVIIAPGGGYIGLASDLEGRIPADWFAAHGVTAFVLRYRLGAGYPFPIPLDDARRAIRLVRANVARYGVDPDRIGMLGFSAGGHLAAMAAAVPQPESPSANDPIDRVSSNLNFLVLAYPWLNAMEPTAYPGKLSYCSIIPSFSADQCRVFEKKYSPARLVTRAMPPTFLLTVSDDDVVPAMVSLDMYQKLLAAGVSAQLHVFGHGGHGVGLGKGDPTLDLWPQLLEAWLRDQGLLQSRLH